MVSFSRLAHATGAAALFALVFAGCSNSDSPPPADNGQENAHSHAGGNHHKPHATPADDEHELFLTPGGKYTKADIAANGGVIASVKFKGIRASHDDNPQPGDVICPISKTKANPKFAWVVGGKNYEFCCPPCVDEFVQMAKDNPEKIKDPDFYRMK
jgi:hypothetical protein